MQTHSISSDLERYNIVKNIVEENDCFLLTSFEEFEERRQTVLNKSYNFVRIDIIASCYHQSNVVFTNLKLRKTGTRCKDCVKDYTRKINLSNGDISSEIEYEGVVFINKFLTPYYEVIRMKEGCKADIAIKPFVYSDNMWIPIQIKTTKGFNS